MYSAEVAFSGSITRIIREIFKNSLSHYFTRISIINVTSFSMRHKSLEITWESIERTIADCRCIIGRIQFTSNGRHDCWQFFFFYFSYTYKREVEMRRNFLYLLVRQPRLFPPFKPAATTKSPRDHVHSCTLK